MKVNEVLSPAAEFEMTIVLYCANKKATKQIRQCTSVPATTTRTMKAPDLKSNQILYQTGV